jgi:hypothetical protein
MIVIIAIASLLIGGGAMVLIWRPWKQRQQTAQPQDRQEVRQEELEELRHQLDVERLNGDINREHVYSHAVWPAYAVLTAIEEAAGHRLTEESFRPVVGWVLEQASASAFPNGPASQMQSAQAQSAQQATALPVQQGQRGIFSWKLFWTSVILFLLFLVMTSCSWISNAASRAQEVTMNQQMFMTVTPEDTNATASIAASNPSRVLVGQIGQTGALQLRVDGRINFGTKKSNGPEGSDWHTGKEYGNNTRRPDVGSGAILFQVEDGPLWAVSELVNLEGGNYAVQGQPGQKVYALINEDAQDMSCYKDGNAGFFNLYVNQ